MKTISIIFIVVVITILVVLVSIQGVKLVKDIIAYRRRKKDEKNNLKEKE